MPSYFFACVAVYLWRKKKILKSLKQQRLINGGEFYNLKWSQTLVAISAYFGTHVGLVGGGGVGGGSVGAARKVSPDLSCLGYCLSVLIYGSTM